MKNIFKATMDSYSNEVTVVITLLFIAICIAQLIFRLYGNVFTISISVLLPAIYLRAYFFKPVSYEITNDLLIIHRLARDISIPRKNLNKVDIIDKEKIKCTTRSFVVSGFFGYCGKFASKQIGSFTMYATRKNKTVLIQTIDNKKVIITPDKPAKFVRQLELNEVR